jgi:Papain family cysteine protease
MAIENKGLGRVPDPKDDRDYLWRKLIRTAPMPLPKTHRKWMRGPVLDQGRNPYCVAYSCTSMKFFHEYLQHRRYYNFDPDELYKQCKQVDGFEGDGTFTRCALDILYARGILAHAKPGNLKSDAYFKIGSYVRLTDLRQIKEAIFLVGPVVFGIQVDSTIDQVGKDGVWPLPNGGNEGGHAMVIFGWNDFRQAFLIKNSWGVDWGASGYAWMPYTHFIAYPDWDAWKSLDQEVIP